MGHIDRERAEDERLRAIRTALLAEAQLVAAADARRTRLLAEASQIAQARTARIASGNSRSREMALRSIAAEFGAALRVNDRTMQRRIDEAEQLLRLFPATVDALESGAIGFAHATTILDTGMPIADRCARQAFEEVVLRRAVHEPPARLRAFARQLAERVNPRSIDERFADARERRLVTVTEVDDGMAELRALLPAVLAFGIADRLDRQAKAIQDADAADRRDRATARASNDADAVSSDAGQSDLSSDADRGDDGHVPTHDERTRAQIRADVFADLLLTGAPAIDPVADRSPGGLGAIRAQVQITVPVTTLTGLMADGAELDGIAPVDSDTARRLAGDATGWDRLMTDPVRGTVLDVDRYEPLTAQRRFLRARDVHCRCPGCRRPARFCQIDHNDERQHGGRTRLGNLAHFCVRHHTMKTETDWRVRQLPGGSLEWTSPLGFSYRDDPPPRVVFVPDTGSPPF